MHRSLLSSIILFFVTSLSPYPMDFMEPTEVTDPTMTFMMMQDPSSFSPQSVQNPFYPWNNTGSHNTQIPLSNTGTKNFSVTFTSNAPNDLTIGLYSPNYKRPGGLSSNNLSAIVECVIGGWDSGGRSNKKDQQSCIRFENDAKNNETQPHKMFTDTVYPHQKYIIPGRRGTDITYTYTVALSDTAFKLSITYIDPTTKTQKELLSITDADVPSAIFDYLRSPAFSGFTTLGFRLYNAGYMVKNYWVQLQNPAPIATKTQVKAPTEEPSQTHTAVDSALLAATTAATASIAAAILALKAAQPVAKTADDTAQKAITAAQALTNKHDLLTKAQKLQNNTAQTPPSGTGPNLAYITQALSTLPTTPQTYLSTEAANTAKTNADTATTAANAIATNSKAVIDSINTLQQAINAQALTDASTAANESIATAITSLNTAQPLAQTADTKAKAAVQTANAVNNQDLLAQAQKLQNNTATNPPSGTGPNLMYITQALAALPQTPQTYTSLDAAIAAKTNADTAKKTVDAITANNQVTLDAIAKLQTTINTGSRSSTSPAVTGSSTALDTLNTTVATQLAQTNKTLADTLTQAQASLTIVTQAVTNAAKLTSKNAARLQKEAAALSKTTNELITKITDLQQATSNITPPYSKQADANTAKTRLIGIVNTTKSLPLKVSTNAAKITSLQKSIKAAN